MSPSQVCIRNIDIYENISEADLMRIAGTAIEDWKEKGTILYKPSNPPKNVYVIKQGEVELYREEDGKKVVIETLAPGDVFGDFGFESVNHSAITTRKSYLCETPTEEFLAIVKHFPEIALNLMRVLAAKTNDYENKIASLSRPAKFQILDELKRLKAKNERRLLNKIFQIPLRISHQSLAEKTGLNRVTVTKIMGELRNEGTVKIDGVTGEVMIQE